VVEPVSAVDVVSVAVGVESVLEPPSETIPSAPDVSSPAHSNAPKARATHRRRRLVPHVSCPRRVLFEPLRRIASPFLSTARASPSRSHAKRALRLRWLSQARVGRSCPSGQRRASLGTPSTVNEQARCRDYPSVLM
jgi:hypothetical protein